MFGRKKKTNNRKNKTKSKTKKIARTKKQSKKEQICEQLLTHESFREWTSNIINNIINKKASRLLSENTSEKKIEVWQRKLPYLYREIKVTTKKIPLAQQQIKITILIKTLSSYLNQTVKDWPTKTKWCALTAATMVKNAYLTKCEMDKAKQEICKELLTNPLLKKWAEWILHFNQESSLTDWKIIGISLSEETSNQKRLTLEEMQTVKSNKIYNNNTGALLTVKINCLTQILSLFLENVITPRLKNNSSTLYEDAICVFMSHKRHYSKPSSNGKSTLRQRNHSVPNNQIRSRSRMFAQKGTSNSLHPKEKSTVSFQEKIDHTRRNGA